MRISDWSSDVCSSGSMPPLMLPAPASGRRGRFGELQEVVQQRVALLRGDALRMELHAVDRQGPVLQAHDHAVVGGQIGRASCRERVCQYVSISVVAVSLKKKKTCTDSEM